MRAAGRRPCMMSIPATRLERPHQDAARRSLRFANQIEALVHPVDEIDVSVAGRAEDDARTRGDSAGGVRGEIVASGVSFGLDNDAGGRDRGRRFCQEGRAPRRQCDARRTARLRMGPKRIFDLLVARRGCAASCPRGVPFGGHAWRQWEKINPREGCARLFGHGRGRKRSWPQVCPHDREPEPRRR